MQKSKTILIVLLSVLLFSSLISLFILWRQNTTLKNNANTESNSIIAFNNQKKVEITNILSGEITENSFCDTGCTVDLKVTYNEKEITLNNIAISYGIQDLDEILNNLSQNESNYYMLRYGSGNESGTYIFSDKGYVSNSFCSSQSTKEHSIVWDDKYLIYNDCGSVGQHLELISGISMLNLETGEITPIIEPVVGNDQSKETWYTIYSVNKANKLLYASECTYSAEQIGDACTIKTVDLSTKILGN